MVDSICDSFPKFGAAAPRQTGVIARRKKWGRLTPPPSKCRVKIAVTSFKKIGDMLTENKGSDYQDFSVANKVSCGSCDKSYIGETGRGMTIRIKEHKRDLCNDMDYSAFVVHAHETHHLPKWEEATVLASCKNKENRKATEAAYIATNDTINTRVGFIKWAKSAAVFNIKKNKI